MNPSLLEEVSKQSPALGLFLESGVFRDEIERITSDRNLAEIDNDPVATVSIYVCLAVLYAEFRLQKEQIAELQKRLGQTASPVVPSNLTDREEQILAMLKDDRKIWEIANEMKCASTNITYYKKKFEILGLL
jgi:hypothetical protein